MTTKSRKQLLALLSEVLSCSLTDEQTKSVMADLESRKDELSKLLGTGNQGGRGKRKKDPNAPKKGKTGYIIFCVEKRNKLKEQNSQLSATEITSRLAEDWRALGEKEKAKYADLAAKDKDRYDQEMKSYTPPTESETDQKPKKSRGKERVSGPKRPLSAYMFFCAETRETLKSEQPNMSGKDVTVELGRRWRTLSEAEKKPYEMKQVADKERYETEKSSSLNKPDDVPKAQPVPKKDTAKDTKDTKAQPAPKKDAPKAQVVPKKDAPKAQVVPPKKDVPKAAKQEKKEPEVKKTQGYDCFCDEQRDDIETENPEWDTKKVNAELMKRWKSLSKEDRDEYESQACDGESDDDDEELLLDE